MSAIDTSISPTLTGAAAKTASSHSSPHPLKLYGAWFCPFVQRAWIVLEEKKIPYQYVEINPYKKDPSFLALNPRGLVPTLSMSAEPAEAASGGGQEEGGGGVGAGEEEYGEEGTRVLYESTILTCYLEEAYPAHPPRLLPRSAYARARARLWIDHANTRIVPAWYKLIQHTARSTYAWSDAVAQWTAAVRPFAAAMLERRGGGGGAGDGKDDRHGPWFLGAHFSLVDATLAPWAARLWLVPHYKQDRGDMGFLYLEGDDDNNDAALSLCWKTWINAVTARDSVLRTLSDRDMYVDVYRRYADDTTRSQVGIATRTGQMLP